MGREYTFKGIDGDYVLMVIICFIGDLSSVGDSGYVGELGTVGDSGYVRDLSSVDDHVLIVTVCFLW